MPGSRKGGGAIPQAVLWAAVLGVAGLLAFEGREIHPVLRIGAAYKAKILCSGVFVSGRPPGSVLAEDLAVDDLWPLRWFPSRLDRDSRIVESGIAGLSQASARYRDGLGCVLVNGGDSLESAAPARSRLPPVPAASAGPPSPQLQAALDWGFAEPEPDRLRRTRALLVMQDGKIVAERYAPGFGPDTPLAGWSMAKLALNALVGILVGQGRLGLDSPAGLPEWRDDPRTAITLDQLLRMSSGLEFSEEYGALLQDVTVMLLLQPSAAAFAAAKPLIHPPGTHWYYASGTSNILSRLIRSALGDEAYRRFPREALFEPLGMEGAVLEQDAAGDYVASSFMYATARDWAKLGQLFLQDGIWQGKRILPEGWLRYSTAPAPSDPTRQYGAHVWLRIPDSLSGPDPVPLPPDAFHAVGFESQFITVVPSRRAVLVRLGLTRHPGAWRQDRWVAKVLEALPD